MKIRALAIITATALAFPMLAMAEPTPPPATDKTDKTNPSPDKTDKTNEKTTNKAGKLSDGDVKVIAHLHHVNQMEIDVGKAAQRAGSAQVKSYGEALEKDHQTADKDLTTLAKQRKLAAIPADKPESEADKTEHKDMMKQVARLKTLKGPDFDKEFLNMMVSGHDKELTKIDVAISSASDPELQTYLKTVKPVLQRHADQARDLQKSPTASMDKSMDKPSDKPSDRPDDKATAKLPSQR